MDLNNIFKANLENSKEIKYFKETSVSDYILLPDKFEDIKKPMNLFSNVCLNSVKLFSSNKLVSNEGQMLNNKILLINYSLKENLKYIGYNTFSNVFFFSFPEILSSCYIVLPDTINNINIEEIVSKNLYNISYYLENIELYCINKRTFYYNITILFNFCPIINYI
ncbi:hypothetical protein [Clostridium taeniosporum]|uniref:Uncharacterized protein n=1 Tax=Clostridium taeniosporum TaxID=394958 RepID=A0A1D7XL07_9CLOT|nr:hypothetical protein [Clostridium taeniosporum]AOR24035.1 hypothetical protein BGI42_09960 [Clostridium taeniosporum]